MGAVLVVVACALADGAFFTFAVCGLDVAKAGAIAIIAITGAEEKAADEFFKAGCGGEILSVHGRINAAGAAHDAGPDAGGEAAACNVFH